MTTDDRSAKHLETIRSYLALVEKLDDPEGLARFWHPEGVLEILPNALASHGSRRDRAARASSFEQGRALLAHQRYEIVSAMAEGDRVIVEFLWTGRVKIDAGPLRAGDELRARCAGFFEMRDGLIYGQRQYDCFEPIGRAPNAT